MAFSLKRFIPIVPKPLGSLIKFMCGCLAILALFAVIAGIVANTTSGVSDAKAFVALHPTVRAMVGDVESGDVAVHSVVQLSTRGQTRVDIVAVATGSRTQGRVVLSGTRDDSTERTQFLLKEITPIRCFLLLVCI